MIGLAVRGLIARPWRALLTGSAAVIGVSLVAGALVLADTAERAGDVGDDVRVVGHIVLVAGAVALLVGGYIINSAFAVNLAQRSRELALLRCLGAEPGQLRRMVRLEALIVGVAASLAGLVVGVGVAAALRAFVNSGAISGDFPGHALVVTPRAVIVSLVAGSVAMVVSAAAPARRASRAAPLAALCDLPAVAGQRSPARAAVGAVLVGATLVGVPLAALSDADFVLPVTAALTLIGVRLVGPRVARPLAGAVGLPVARWLRLTGALARQNAMRSPDRTAATASALTIGLALVSFIAVLSSSTKAFVDAEFDRTPDVSVVNGEVGAGGAKLDAPGAVPPAVIARLRALPEVGTLVPVAGTVGTVAGIQAGVQAADLSAFTRVQGLDVTAGNLADVSPGGLWVRDDSAAAGGLTVGARVPVELAHGRRVLTIRAVYRHESYASTSLPRYLIGRSDYAALGGSANPGSLLIRAAVGVTPEAARAAVARAVAGGGSLIVEDRGTERRDAVGQIDTYTSLYLALGGLAALVGLFGILNTTALSIVERMRELGLLRAIGMDRGQIRAMIRAEAVIVAAVGAVPGIALGTLFGWGAAKVLEESSAPTAFTVPIAVLALIAVVAAGGGVLAAVLPARWASRVDVLRAVASE
jgi:putative ABC transport system permease protein